MNRGRGLNGDCCRIRLAEGQQCEEVTMKKEARSVNRRRFLQQSASLAALGVTALISPPARAEEARGSDDPMRVPGNLPRPYGERSSFEQPTRLGGAGPGSPHGWGANAPNNFKSLTPLQSS